MMIAVQVLPQAAQRPTEGTSIPLDLYEAVIRFQIKSWQPASHTYCIGIKGADPDPALLERLRPLKVKGSSACQMRNERVVDGKLKESVIFNLAAFQKVSESEVEVEGGYLCGNMCMAKGAYRVVREASGWHVVEFEAHLTF